MLMLCFFIILVYTKHNKYIKGVCFGKRSFRQKLCLISGLTRTVETQLWVVGKQVCCQGKQSLYLNICSTVKLYRLIVLRAHQKYS